MAQDPYLSSKGPEKRETTFFYPVTINEEKSIAAENRGYGREGLICVCTSS